MSVYVFVRLYLRCALTSRCISSTIDPSRQESPLAHNVKEAIVRGSEADTIYGKNFDGLYARVMKTPASERAMRSPTNPLVAAYRSFEAAQMIGMPLWKVIPGLLTQYDKIYQLSLFGAATKKLIAATVDGDLDSGVQVRRGLCTGARESARSSLLTYCVAHVDYCAVCGAKPGAHPRHAHGAGVGGQMHGRGTGDVQPEPFPHPPLSPEVEVLPAA